jgi:hypothetical protein
MNRLFVVLGGIAAAAAVAMATVGPVSGADHGDAPLAKANHAEDIADVYAFAGSGGNVVLAMTVNPLTMPGDTPAFDSAGLYQFRIDNTGDAVPDVTYNVTFGAAAGDGSQDLTVKRATGADADALTDSGDTVVSGKSTGGMNTAVINNMGGVKAFAGLRDDPFFFDLNAFKAGLAFRNPGNNFFAGLNASAIVLEVPSNQILASGSTMAGVWAVTSKSGAVIDRMGRPAIATVFIPADQKDAFNNTKPAADVATWKSTVVASLNSLGSDPALADALLPDILTFDTSKPWGFLNGRQLADDVIDAELQLITGNMAASDNVANDSNFGTQFPYISAANTAPAPTPIAATAPTAAAPANTPAAAATRPSGVTAPNTGTGGGTGSDSDATMWVIVGLAAAAVVAAGGAVAVRRRG